MDPSTASVDPHDAHELLGAGALHWDPTGEWIFPSIVSGARFGAAALARWYLYYSPHEAPGGIGLALADDIRGPWREHSGNPLIVPDWPPHHQVSHVASPHAVWLDDSLHLFYHGENDTTHLATSGDGLTFTYAGVAIGPQHPPQLQERSYARVFPRLHPAMREKYTMLFMGRAETIRAIWVARSDDARSWHVDPSPLIVPPNDLGMAASGPWLHVADGSCTVLHHIDRFVGDPRRFDVRGGIYATPVDPDLRQAGTPRPLHLPQDTGPDAGRAADPVVVEQDGTHWLVYLAGRRLQGRIRALRLR